MVKKGLAAYRTLTTGSVAPAAADSLYELDAVSAMLADRGDPGPHHDSGVRPEVQGSRQLALVSKNCPRLRAMVSGS